MVRPTIWSVLALFLLLAVASLASAEEEEHEDEGSDGGWTGPWTGGDCAHCHRANSVGIPDPAEEDDHRGVARDCQDCHLGGDKEAPYPPAEHHQDLDSICTDCHRTGNREGAPVPTTGFVVQSQRAWQKENGAHFAEWVKGRGPHPDATDCLTCHQGAGGSTEVTDDCLTCHTWLQAEISQPGFGSTSYQGTMDPATLLQGIKDMDSDGRTHNAIYNEFGCTGFCHNAGITVDAAEAWGGAMTDPTGGGVDPGLAPSTDHGHISKCTDCHRVSSPLGGPADLHTTHIPFVTAEQIIADPDDFPMAACEYCHSSGPEPGSIAGGCYNCHLSGHFPETVYWEMETPTAPTAPMAVSAPAAPASGQVAGPVLADPAPTVLAPLQGPVSGLRGGLSLW